MTTTPYPFERTARRQRSHGRGSWHITATCHVHVSRAPMPAHVTFTGTKAASRPREASQ